MANLDPLSITTAILGIGTVAASTSRAFQELRELCKTLPGRLHALSNEVSDIELVLYQVASVVESELEIPHSRKKRPIYNIYSIKLALSWVSCGLLLRPLRKFAKRPRSPSFEYMRGGRTSQDCRLCKRISERSSVVLTSCSVLPTPRI